MRLGAQPPEAAIVETQPVRAEEVEQTVSLVGTAQPQRESRVAAQIDGAVSELRVEEGDRVRKGDTLALLDADELRIRIQAAKAARAEFEARRKEQAGRFDRSKKLYERGRISEEEYREDQHGAEALQHSVERAQHEIQALEDQLRRKTVTAPFDGYVSQKHTEVGEWVQEGDPIVELLDLSKVHVVVDLPERYAPSLQRDTPVPIRVDALPGQQFTGRIVAVIPESDLQTHTLPVKIEIANPETLFHAGMFVRASLAVAGTTTALLVPKDAVVSRRDEDILFVVENGAAKEVKVRRVQDYENFVVVSGDLREGQLVVVRGNERLRDGQPIEVRKQSAALADTGRKRTP